MQYKKQQASHVCHDLAMSWEPVSVCDLGVDTGGWCVTKHWSRQLPRPPRCTGLDFYTKGFVKSRWSPLCGSHPVYYSLFTSRRPTTCLHDCTHHPALERLPGLTDNLQKCLILAKVLCKSIYMWNNQLGNSMFMFVDTY